MGADQYKIDVPSTADQMAGFDLLSSVLKSNRQLDNAERNTDVQAQYAKNANERLSHQEARDQAEETRRAEEHKYRRELEKRAAFSGLAREANHSGIGAANFLGEPYGIKFDQTTDLAPSQEGPEVTPQLEDARQGHPLGLMGAAVAGPAPEAETPAENAAEGGHEEGPMPQGLPANAEGPEQIPDLEAARHRSVIKAEEPISIIANEPGSPPPAAAPPEPPPLPGVMNTRLWANVLNGSRFEVPKSDETTGLGPQYDAYYKKLIDLGEKPNDALRIVAAEHKNDTSQKAIADRVAAQIGSREGIAEKYRMEAPTQEELRRLAIEQSGKNAETMAHARIASAAPEVKIDSSNQRDMSVLQRQAAALRQTTQFAKLVAADKTTRGLMENIADGAVPLQHHDAQIQLARIFRQAQPTEGEMRLLYNNLGGTMDKWNQFVAKMEAGDLSPEQLRQVQVTAKVVKAQSDEDRSRFADVAKSYLGPGMGFDLMPDKAEGMYQGMAKELGLKHLPPLYDTTGGAILGSGLRPEVHKRPPPAHPAAEPVGATRPGPGGKTYRKVGPNNWQPVQE